MIDATLGLGEALVAGLVEPDHYVVDTATGRITSKELGAKALVIRSDEGGGVSQMTEQSDQIQALTDVAILELAQLGQRVAEHYDNELKISSGDGQMTNSICCNLGPSPLCFPSRPA